MALPTGSPPRVWGKPASARRGGAPAAVHPHGCGENFIEDHQSPPSRRFTPTGVGKTLAPVAGKSHTLGSPPRVWGKLKFAGGKHETRKVHPHGCGENPAAPCRGSGTL